MIGDRIVALLRRSLDPGPPPALTEEQTRVAWVLCVQRLIVKHSRPSEDPDHDQTDVLGWLEELAEEIMGRAPTGGEPYDENMYAASRMGLVLVTWYLRIQRAKAYDPNRPVKLRKHALEIRHAFVRDLLAAIDDESLDPAMFPGQEWDPPHAPGAHDGDFI